MGSVVIWIFNVFVVFVMSIVGTAGLMSFASLVLNRSMSMEDMRLSASMFLFSCGFCPACLYWLWVTT